jgi:hypothetical protein
MNKRMPKGLPSNRELPSTRHVRFLEFVDEMPFGPLGIMILGAYVGLVTLVSLVEIIALICFDQNWVKGANGWWDILYFNFMIILTVGYGDFVPLGFGEVLSSLEALAGVGLFAGGVSLLTIKALRPSAHTIVFSKYAYYCKKEQRFLIIFLNTSVARLESCTISSYFKLGRDWSVKPAIATPFLTKAVQTFYIDEHPMAEISEKLTEGDCLRVCVAGNLLGSEVAETAQYRPDEILIIENRDLLASYEPFWHPDFGDEEFAKMSHYRPADAKSLQEEFGVR